MSSLENKSIEILSLEEALYSVQLALNLEIESLLEDGYEPIAFPETFVPDDRIVVGNVLRVVLPHKIIPFKKSSEPGILVQEIRPIVLGERINLSEWDTSASEAFECAEGTLLSQASRTVFLSESDLENLSMIDAQCLRKTAPSVSFGKKVEHVLLEK